MKQFTADKIKIKFLINNQQGIFLLKKITENESSMNPKSGNASIVEYFKSVSYIDGISSAQTVNNMAIGKEIKKTYLLILLKAV